MAAATEPETQLCGNCKKDIPVANFTIHEIHCSRNLEVCCYCRESIPKTEMKKHVESEHVQVTCKCSMKIEKSLLEDHEASACPLRPAVCQHCDLQLAFNKLHEHESYCGARTERCSGCGLNVMVRDLKEHPQVCGKEEKQVKIGKTVPRFEHGDADLRSLRDIKNQLRSDNCAGPLWRMPRVLENQLYGNSVGDKALKDIRRRNVSAGQRNWNREDELEQLARNKPTNSPLSEEQSASLDYLLALSLQNETRAQDEGTAETHSDFWKNCYTKEPLPAARRNGVDKTNSSCHSRESFTTSNLRKSNEIMLPCEFCEELYPAEDLILHQTGCNPAIALASFRKRSSSPKPRKYDDLHDFGPISRRVRPRAVQAEGNIMIPCEFCGIQLEEEVLFHHQDQCDLRPETASVAEPLPSQQPPSPQDSAERRDSPELARRRPWHRGAASPRCAEGFRQQRPSGPARGAGSPGAVGSARSAPPGCSARAADALGARGRPRKAGAPEGRAKSRAAHEPASGTAPRTRPPHNFHGENFTSGFSRASPTQRSLGNGGGRTSGVPGGFRNRNMKAKPQSPEFAYPEEE